jgi:hypothetical protein
MKKYRIFLKDELVGEHEDVMSLYTYLKAHIKGADKFTPMVLAKELVTPGKVYFRDNEDKQYIILLIPEETE